jgi:predicted nucleic acid-binding protein
MKPKVYIETTIVSYLTSRKRGNVNTVAQRQATKEWWVTAPDRFELFVSQFVIEEAAKGDRVSSAQRMGAIADLPVLRVNDDVSDLAELLIRMRAMPRKAAGDALHLSLAAVHGIDFLLTWNCKHLANALLRRKIEEV